LAITRLVLSWYSLYPAGRSWNRRLNATLPLIVSVMGGLAFKDVHLNEGIDAIYIEVHKISCQDITTHLQALRWDGSPLIE